MYMRIMKQTLPSLLGRPRTTLPLTLGSSYSSSLAFWGAGLLIIDRFDLRVFRTVFMGCSRKKRSFSVSVCDAMSRESRLKGLNISPLWGDVHHWWFCRDSKETYEENVCLRVTVRSRRDCRQIPYNSCSERAEKTGDVITPPMK